MSRRDVRPAATSPLGRRRPGTGKLVFRPKTGAYGRDHEGRTLWRFQYRLARRSRVIAAVDWRDADRQADVLFTELFGQARGDTTRAVASRTVNELCDAFLASRGGTNSRTRPSTVDGYGRALDRTVRPFLGTMAAAAVSPADITEWQRHHPRGKSRTRQKQIVLLAMLFRFAVEQDWRPTSPVRKQHRVSVLKAGERQGKLRGDQRVGIALTPSQLDAITTHLDHPDDLLVRLTAWTGLRVSELTHLRPQDLSADGGTLTVANDISCRCRDCLQNGGERQTKNGRARLVPVAPELVQTLQSYREERAERFGSGGWLFCRWYRPRKSRHAAGSQRARRDVLVGFQEAARSADIQGLVFHDLRNTAHTWLTERSHGHLVAVSVTLGHRLPGMAETYNRLAADPMALARALFPDTPLLRLELVG